MVPARARLPARATKARKREPEGTCESVSKADRRLFTGDFRRGGASRAVNHKEYAVVNLDDLERFDAGTEVTPDLLIGCGIVKKVMDGVKILGYGELTKALTVKAHKFSKTAEEKIKAVGGTAEVL